MQDLIFLFDLDSTITKAEILPAVAALAGCEQKMRELTERSMYEAVPFRQSFIERVELLRGIPVSQVRSCIAQIPLHEQLVDFIREHKERCYIVTGNLDVWIEELLERMDMTSNVFCSKGVVKNDTLCGVSSVIDKDKVVEQFVSDFVAVGDGSNDADMIMKAKVGIGFGGVRPIAPSVLEVASHAIYDEGKLVQFLNRLV